MIVDPGDLRLPRWVVVWFVVSAIVQAYDGLFVLLGPLSHPGGALVALWPGHVFYSTFDHRYAGFDAFNTAQSTANLFEVVGLVVAIALTRRWSGVVAGFLLVAVLPNSIWLVVPLCVIVALVRRILRVGRALTRASTDITTN